MTMVHDDNYVLKIEGGDTEVLAQFNEAFCGTRLSAYITQDVTHPERYSSLLNNLQGGGLNEETIEEELHGLALQFPNLYLHFIAEDLEDRSHGYELKFHGDLYQRADIVTELTDFCPPVPFDQRAEARMSELQRTAKVYQLLQTITKQTDYDLLYAQKQALLKASETGCHAPKEALDGIVHFLDRIGDLGEALGRFQYDGIDPPFPMQPDYKKTDYTFEPEQRKIYILCEEFEGDNGIREFAIHATSENEGCLEALLKAKVEKDEYGFFAMYGPSENLDNYASTEFVDGEGFVSYYIQEQGLLSPEQAKALLNEPEYKNTYRYPDNLRDLLLPEMNERAKIMGYLSLDVNKVVDTILSDKAFEAMIKTSWWGDRPHIADNDNGAKRMCHAAFHSHLSGLLDQNPDWFVTIGALEPFIYPDNLPNILHNSYYDVCRDYHLPVRNIRKEVDSIMRNPNFQSLFNNLRDIPHLQEGSDRYQEALRSCYDYLQDKLVPEEDIAEKQPRLSDMLADAQKRKLTEKSNSKASAEKGQEPTR